MSDGVGDPLNIYPLNIYQVTHFCGEERVDIVYRPHDRYTEIAEHIVNQWTKYLKMRGILKGELGHSDELEMLIAEEFRKECNDNTEKTRSE